MADLLSTNPYDLDWGTITPSAYNEKELEILHIFNFDISTKDKIDRVITFSIGKVLWTSKNVPQEAKQKIIFDLRGQPITFTDRARKMKNDILAKINQIEPLKIIIIEILI